MRIVEAEVREEKGPVVKSYQIETGREILSERVTSSRNYLRALSLKISPGREKI